MKEPAVQSHTRDASREDCVIEPKINLIAVLTVPDFLELSVQMCGLLETPGQKLSPRRGRRGLDGKWGD